MLLSKSKILQRGWTEKLINVFLSEPILKQNPIYKSASPMKMWEEDEVVNIEQSEEFQHQLEKAKKRQLSAQKAVETKKEKLKYETQRFLNSVKIKVIDRDALEHKAVNSVKQWKREQYYTYAAYDFHFNEDDFNVEDIDTETKNRWMVNYIRHHLTKYDRVLERNFGKVGNYEMYLVIKHEILLKIAEAYPYLKNECYKQIQQMQLDEGQISSHSYEF